MKVRYCITGYTACMLVILLYIFRSFMEQSFPKRDMVYYNEQCILIAEELGRGEDIEKIQGRYGCKILL